MLVGMRSSSRGEGKIVLCVHDILLLEVDESSFRFSSLDVGCRSSAEEPDRTGRTSKAPPSRPEQHQDEAIPTSKDPSRKAFERLVSQCHDALRRPGPPNDPSRQP